VANLVTDIVSIDKLKKLKKTYSTGILISLLIGFAALYLSSNYGAPAMLMALLLGMSFNFLSSDEVYSPGLEFCAKTVLRTGVALLGIRITVGEIASLGVTPILMVCLAVVMTILFGIFCAKKMGFTSEFGLLTGGSVAICGASAAMAISAILPQNEETKRNTLFAVIAVTTLSTISMVLYPLLAANLNLSINETGFFLGGTIHDVAQVVGAGYSVSEEAGDMSTFIKLIRVATLVPIVLIASIFLMKKSANKEGGKASIPFFLIGFVLIFLINSTGFIPTNTIETLTAVSSKMLLFAVAALGVRTSLKDVLTVGLKPIILVVIETLFIATVILLFIFMSR
jgi:uncharacterized integral membrane protein (TIGR00698 family)